MQVNRIPNEPVIFYLSAIDAVKATFELPNGKSIVLTQSVQYETSDDEEIEFLSKQRYVGVKRLGDKEFRYFAAKQFENLPTVYNEKIKSASDVEEFSWSSESEQRIIAKLRENGYIVYKKGEGKAK